jgi:hypothetical protein
MKRTPLVAFGRGATIDGSRAFQRPVEMRMMRFRRGATVERRDDIAPRSGKFNCRSATTIRGGDANRGMNAPATITRSLRDQDIQLADLNREPAPRRGFGRGATIDGSRAFQRPVAMWTMRFRRAATV